VKSAREISELAGVLGTRKGLRLVQSEMKSFCNQVSDHDPGLSPAEVVNIDKALSSLGGAIVEMRRVVSAMLAQAGVTSHHVG